MKAVKIISAVTALCICFLSFCACGINKTALTVNSTPVSEEVFGYFLSVAENSYNYTDDKNKQKLAKELCAEYVAGEEMIKKYSIELSAEEKVVVSSEVKANWQMYSDFYKKYSVSKQTLCEILEHESLINSLVKFLYGADGERALSEQEVKAFFNANYLAAKTAFTPFDAQMSESEIKKITDNYSTMATSVRSGGSFASAVEQFPDMAESEDNAHIISAFDTSYPDGLFKKVAQGKNGETMVLRYSTGIYLVQRVDSSEYYDMYRSECIVKMKKDYVLGEIKAAAQSYKVEAVG
ncbi:MAG: hypothetical protein IJZ88_07050 [Clostridia bacterium]|nr:hypothetical protein [Clostridia bacterium]